MLQGDPSLVFALYARLPQDSMTRAQERDPENWRFYMGADPHYYVLAAIYDAVNVNTRATGMYKKGKAPSFEPWVLPENRVKAERMRRERATVKGFFRMVGGVATVQRKKGEPVTFTPVPMK